MGSKTVAVSSVPVIYSFKSTYLDGEVAQKREFAIIAGTASQKLANAICNELNTQLTPAEITRFSDGELIVKINETIREKDVFIIQTCANPVNDNLIELLLSVAAAKRAGALSVTAVIPYFGYKHNRRGLTITTTHHSRFLWNAAGDLAKMLHCVGVDKVVTQPIHMTKINIRE